MTAKNGFHAKSHKERSQLSHRHKLGLLEKHKDYVQRAQNYHKKQKALSLLKQKAQFRNPDEFDFGMIKAKTSKGVHILQRNEQFDHEMLKLLKTQDENYIQYQRSINLEKLKELQQSLDFTLQEKQLNEHVIFVDNQDQAKNFDPIKHFNASKDSIQCHWNRLPDIASNASNAIHALNKSQHAPEAHTLEKLKSQRLREYKDRQQRHEKLTKVAQELQLQKQLMGKGPRKKVGVDSMGLAIYKWKAQRKK